LIPTGERSGLQTHIATMESVSLCVQMKNIVGLAATVREQAAQIQKVSAQLEASKPAPRVVNNP
jgi:hypothetical protein